MVYVESARSRQARRVRRASKVLEFARPEDGHRVIPQLVLDLAPPEEASWVAKYLDLADHALDNHDLSNPAARPQGSGAVMEDFTGKAAGDGMKVGNGIDTRGPLRRPA